MLTVFTKVVAKLFFVVYLFAFVTGYRATFKCSMDQPSDAKLGALFRIN